MGRDRPADATPVIVSVVGTRPEAIKLRPVLRALRRKRVDQRVLLTGQHHGLAEHFEFLPPAAVQDLGINVAEQSAGELREAMHEALCRRLHRTDADLVLVQGDTSSAYAGALAARDRGIALGHVEAGLRSFDWNQPWPEEGYRVAIDALSDLLFAPTAAALHNLQAEPRVQGILHLTGNSGIDALFEALGDGPERRGTRSGRKPILLTCHRRENRGEPTRRVARACRKLVAELPVEITVLLHPSPLVRRPLQRLLRDVEHIRLAEPLGYREMVAAMASSWLIVTDSGGIQEEAPALGRPALVLREVTERSEAVLSDNAELVGTDPDRIVAAVAALLADCDRYARMSRPNLPFGDGRAAIRIADAIEAFLARPPAERRLAAPLPPPCVAAALA